MRLQKSMIKLLKPGDVFSLANLVFGIISIISILNNNYWLAFSLILLSALSDGLDGMVARKFGSGRIGENLDSLADLSSFSISPSLLVFSNFTSPYIIPVLLLYIACSAIRLSSFHLLKNERYFVGMPVTGAGLILISSCMILNENLYIGILMILLSVAMISNISYPKPDKIIGSLALSVILLNLILGKCFDMVFVKVLFASSIIYALVGPFYVRISGD